MSRVQVVYLHISAVLTAITGGVFAWMKYAMTTEDPFAVANHPWQPHFLSAHVVAAPLLVFALGWIFGDHILPKYQQRNAPQRKSGLWSLSMLVPMTLSGYLIQIGTNDALRKAMTWIHWAASALFVVAYAIHVVTSPARVNGR